jgi:hypothetical protein
MFLERVNIHPRSVFQHRFDDDGTDEFQQVFLTIILLIPAVMTLLLAMSLESVLVRNRLPFVPKMAEINSVFETGGRNCLLGSACRGQAAMTCQCCVVWRPDQRKRREGAGGVGNQPGTSEFSQREARDTGKKEWETTTLEAGDTRTMKIKANN